MKNNPYRKLKVLKNDLQHWIYDGEDLSFATTNIPHNVVFNRSGLYKLGKNCWYEFKLEDGSFIACKLEDAESFTFKLKTIEAELNPICNEDWEKILTLVKRKIIPSTDRFKFESHRRDLVRMKAELFTLFKE